MLRNKICYGILISSLIFGSCGDRLLDSSPDDKYVESNFWNTEAAADAALTGVYSILRYDGIYGNEATPLWEDTATPNAYNYSDAKGFNSIASGKQMETTGGVISNRWKRSYAGIGRANSFLANVEHVDMDEEKKSRMIGEAKFLRALYYFFLEAYYGDAPLILDPPALEQAELPRTPRAEIVAQIIKDLDEAAQSLPAGYSGNDLGRATTGAALGLKARVLLFEASPLVNTNNDASKWEAAAQAAKAVIDLGQYDLYPDYRALFLPANENNEEVIFDVQYIYPDGGHSFDLICRQYNTNAPLRELIDAYYMKDGLPFNESSLYDPTDIYANRDPRMAMTIVYPGATYMGETVSNSRFAVTGYGMKKYSIYDEEKPPADLADLKGGQSETNYIVLRYADILLMYAEALNEVSGPSQEIYDALNAIRERSEMPPIAATHTRESLRDVIRHERRIEFVGEGYYYNDIRRWKLGEEMLSGPVHAYNGKELEVRSFDPARDYWWPIPLGELDLNNALEQNPGY